MHRHAVEYSTYPRGPRSKHTLQVFARTYAVEAPHLAPLATKGFFRKCRNGNEPDAARETVTRPARLRRAVQSWPA
jgi:hypothetical protein